MLGVQQAISSCHVEEPWLSAWRGLANYTVPKIDVQVSGILRSMAEHRGDQRPGVERRVGERAT